MPDLNNIWRSANLWNDDATPYLTRLKATGPATSENELDDTANLNMANSSARDDLAGLQSRRTGALSELCHAPTIETARHAYQLLVAQRKTYSGAIAKLKLDPAPAEVAARSCYLSSCKRHTGSL